MFAGNSSRRPVSSVFSQFHCTSFRDVAMGVLSIRVDVSAVHIWIGSAWPCPSIMTQLGAVIVRRVLAAGGVSPGDRRCRE